MDPKLPDLPADPPVALAPAPAPTPQDLRKQLQQMQAAERAERMSAAHAEIRQILEKYGCDLIATFLIDEEGVKREVKIVAVDR